MAMDVHAGVQVVAEVMSYGLVDILVTAATSAALGPWRAIVVVRAGFVITPRSPIKVGTSGPRPGGFGVIMLDSHITTRAATPS